MASNRQNTINVYSEYHMFTALFTSKNKEKIFEITVAQLP